MENQKKLIESPLGGKAAPLMIPMVTSASVDQNEGTQVEVGAISTAKAVFDSTTDRKDSDFVNEKLIQSTGKDRSVQEMIVSILGRAPTGQMASDELQKTVMEQVQCSKSTYDKARSSLAKTKLLRNVRVGLAGGKGYWMTALSNLES